MSHYHWFITTREEDFVPIFLGSLGQSGKWFTWNSTSSRVPLLSHSALEYEESVSSFNFYWLWFTQDKPDIITHMMATEILLESGLTLF